MKLETILKTSSISVYLWSKFKIICISNPKDTETLTQESLIKGINELAKYLNISIDEAKDIMNKKIKPSFVFNLDISKI